MPLYRAVYSHSDRRPSGITFAALDAEAATKWAELWENIDGRKLLTVKPLPNSAAALATLSLPIQQSLFDKRGRVPA